MNKIDINSVMAGDRMIVRQKGVQSLVELVIHEWSPEKRHILIQWSLLNNVSRQWFSVEYFEKEYEIVEIIRGKNWKRLDEMQKEVNVCQQ